MAIILINGKLSVKALLDLVSALIISTRQRSPYRIQKAFIWQSANALRNYMDVVVPFSFGKKYSEIIVEMHLDSIFDANSR